MISPDSDKIPVVTVPAPRISRLGHEADDKTGVWSGGWLAYRLDCRDDTGRRRILGLQIDPFSLPILARPLREYSPGIRITD